MKLVSTMIILGITVLTITFQNCSNVKFNNDQNNSSAPSTQAEPIKETPQTEPPQSLPPVIVYTSKLSSGTMDNTCAVINGGLKCWGRNTDSNIGDGTSIHVAQPKYVIPAGSGVTAVSSGGTAGVCAIVQGGVKCWGVHTNGKSVNEVVSTPQWVTTLGPGSGVTEIYRGGHVASACALVQNILKCWGGNKLNIIASGVIFVETPVEIQTLKEPILDVAITNHTICILYSSHRVQCRGLGNFLGDNLGQDRAIFADVLNLDMPTERLGTNENSICAKSNNKLKCWGIDLTFNPYSTIPQLPDKINLLPAEILTENLNIKQVSVNGRQLCILTHQGKTKCLGSNANGILGNGSLSKFESSFVDVIGLPNNVTEVSVGTSQSCAITDNEEVYCWGLLSTGAIQRTAIRIE